MEATVDIFTPTNPIWFSTMPKVRAGTESRVLKPIPLSLQLNEVLPAGEYSVEVVLTGPDGVKQTATTKLEVRHAS